jgi:hypothetical protein
MIHSRDFSIKIYNGIFIWNQQELLYKMVYKLYDLVKPPLNGHGPFYFLKFFRKISFGKAQFTLPTLFLIFFPNLRSKLTKNTIWTFAKSEKIGFFENFLFFFVKNRIKYNVSSIFLCNRTQST